MKLSNRLLQVLADLVEVASNSGALGPFGEAERVQLQGRLVDAFEKGEIGEARAILLKRAPTARERHRVDTLVDSALEAAGFRPSSALRAWGAALEGIGSVPGGEGQQAALLSPVRDAFRGIRVPVDAETSNLMFQLSLDQARLDASLDRARRSAEPLQALEALRKKLDIASTPDSIVMGLVLALADNEAWSAVTQVFDEASPSFRHFPIPRRAYALALLQLDRIDEAVKVLEQLTTEVEPDNLTHGLLGKAYLRKYDSAEAADAPGWLSKAIEAYRDGFVADRSDLYPGIAIPALLEMRGDPASRVEAARFADTMLSLTLSRISYGERNYWDHAAALTLALIKHDEPLAEKYQLSLSACRSEPWMLRSTRALLDRVHRVRTERGENAEPVAQAIERLDALATDGRQSTAESATDTPLATLLASCYRFGGRSSKRLGGNYHLDGIAHDVRVAPADVAYFARVIAGTGLGHLTEPRAASSRMDQIIRTHFGTAAMEHVNSDGHARFDSLMVALACFMGASTENSQTNVSADWINRMADCRQHAPAKLLLFESWKRLRTQKLIEAIDHALLQGQPVAPLERALAELNAWELRILDAVIKDRDTNEKLEEHTLTLLVHRKPTPLGEEMRELKALYLADSFYQNVHKLGSGKVDVTLVRKRLRIDVPEISASGRSIRLEPTPYSYDRAAPSIDFGQLNFRGIQVASPGWQDEVPIEGVDLAYLHEGVLAAMPKS